jgi:hypothetical protein
MGQPPAPGGGPWGQRGRVGGAVCSETNRKQMAVCGPMPKELVPRPWGYRPVFGKDSGRPCGLAGLATRVGVTVIIFDFRHEIQAL